GPAHPVVEQYVEETMTDQPSPATTAREILPASSTRQAPASRSGSPSDEALVCRVLAGEAHCYEDLIARYERPIVNFIYRMTGDYEQSLDLAQEVFYKAYRSLSRFDPSYRFSTWIYRIASNRSIDFLRRQSPVLISLDDPGDGDRGGEGALQLRSPTQGP